MALNLPELPETEKVSTSVIRILGGNPSKASLNNPFPNVFTNSTQGSNTYLLGTGPTRILLDTGEGRSSWRDALSSLLTSEKATIATTLLSHWHHDHIGGVSDLRTHIQPNPEIS
ncbi:Beta-lactamase-like protein, partial [Cyphellophora attinorum]